MTKIKILHTKTVRELAHQYERVGVYRVNGKSAVGIILMMVGVYDRLPDQYPALKAGNWEFEFQKYLEFQAISYININGCKMLMMVEDEQLDGATITLAFSGPAEIPILLADRYDTIYQKGEDILQLREVFMERLEKNKPAPKLSRWQRFKNWFRFGKKKQTSSSGSVLDDIGDAISDVASSIVD